MSLKNLLIKSIEDSIDNYIDIISQKYNIPKRELLDIWEEKEKYTPNKIFIDTIEEQTKKESTNNIWINSEYKDIVKLQSNNAGIVGEKFIKKICLLSGLNCMIDGTKTKMKGGDGYINNKLIEIKTSHKGSKTDTFQHEMGESPWISEYIIFVDISPENIYLTIFKNFKEETYKNKLKCEPYFPNKCITWRKRSGAFKLDTNVQTNERNTILGYCIKIFRETTIDALKNFILSNIK